MLEMRHVTKIFNPGTVDEKIALNDLSFTLNDGDFVTCLLYTSPSPRDCS